MSEGTKAITIASYATMGTLIVTLGFYVWEVPHLIDATNAQRFATELEVFTQAQRMVNDSSRDFNKNHYHELADYIQGETDTLSETAWAELRQMMNYAEYLAWLLNKRHVQLEGATEPVTKGLIPIIKNFVRANKKKLGEKTGKYLGDYYPQCLELLKKRDPEFLKELQLM